MYMPDHRQNRGGQVMQHSLVLAPEMSKEKGKVAVQFAVREGKSLL